MKCLSKKILCYIICGLLTFSVTSTVYYKSVYAMEWVGGALAFEEALKWLLAAIGITATAGMTDAYWDTYGDDFVDYAVENGATQTEVAEWQLKACQGIIDKGSEVWQKFKAWAHDLVNGSGGDNFLTVSSAQNIVNILGNMYGFSINLPNEYKDTTVYGVYCNYVRALGSTGTYVVQNINLFTTNPSTNSSTNVIYAEYIMINFITQNSYSRIQTGRNSSFNNDSSCAFSSNILSQTTHYNHVVSIPWGAPEDVSDENFEASATNVNDLDVISSDGVDEDNPEVTIPIPGVSDSDNEASKDAYQDIIDAINDGTITQEQGVEQIQEILKIVTYDTVTDKVVPPQQNEDGTDKTKDDALKENKENIGFTLGGLEAVFPFCIPFDIYAFMTLLVAEPVCPEFDFPIKSVNGQVEEIHIDLEPFEPVAVVVRYCFDFLFIIGLAMLTRSLIGGGSSD